MGNLPLRQFGGLDHDSLQFHFFCQDLIGTCRLFRTNTLEHASLWIAESGKTTEIYSASDLEPEGTGERPNISAGALSFRDVNGAIIIGLDDVNASNNVSLRISPNTELRWGDTISEVLHLPDMEVEINLNGTSHAGKGYCKLYGWTPAPHYWGYRFVQGFSSDGNLSVWTAEATFGTGKYDYFQLLFSDGTVLAADPDKSCHRQDGVFALLNGSQARISLEEEGIWSTPLQSDGMDSMMRQRVCRMKLEIDGREITGHAINETCYGTLG